MALVEYRSDGAVAVLTLQHPPVNALSSAVIADLDDAITEAEDPTVRAVVVTGSPNFAAGADITEFRRMFEGDSPGRRATTLGTTIDRLEMLAKPVIAAIRGVALGGGLELAMGCDFRFLAEDARVGQPEIKLGIIPGAGGTQRLPRLIGMGRARDIVYSGRFVSAAEAIDIGLADRMFPADRVLDEAIEHARAWATGPTAAIGLAKEVINRGSGIPLAEALALEARAFDAVFATADAREGIEAFLGKRSPDFSGR